ncbi:hypothetical protein RclHR1_09060014 [Rhizophagus clarus]|uniref:Uncharacterized protein n=1 Tax=Rhizophagus clarus TaxID=94130 RepID=A0A2Z6SPI9_9GLOM|nr:hypothetical protein RclHR1_09060014 [Rhizophagus clarus]
MKFKTTIKFSSVAWKKFWVGYAPMELYNQIVWRPCEAEELICITEDKQHKVPIGFAQNIKQLESACETNKKKRKRSDNDFDYLYGIVTTGRDWHFLLYSPEKISKASDTINLIEFSRKALKPNSKSYQSLCDSVKEVLGIIARDIYKLFEKIGIDKIKYITTYSANSISELSDSQIQTIVDYFSKNPNTELPDDRDGTIIDFEEDISNDQDNVLEEQAKPLVSATRAEVSIPTAPIPLTHVSNSSGDSSSSKKLDTKIEVVPPIPQPESLVHDRSYFRNKTLDQYPALYREFSSEHFDYYGITDETSCPLCKLGHDDEESIEGVYKSGSYFIKCEQREIEITA